MLAEPLQRNWATLTLQRVQGKPCASSCASVREAAPVWPRQNNLARRQTSPPLVTQPRSGARMTQVLVSLNTLGLEMNRQVMTVRELHLTSSAATQVIWKYGDAKSRQAWILSPD